MNAARAIYEHRGMQEAFTNDRHFRNAGFLPLF